MTNDLLDGKLVIVGNDDPSLIIWVSMWDFADDACWVIERDGRVLDKNPPYCFVRWYAIDDFSFKTAQDALGFWNENRDKIYTGGWV